MLGALLIGSIFAQDRLKTFEFTYDGGSTYTVATDPISPINFSAATIQRDGMLLYLKGSVVVRFGDKTLNADEAYYHLDTGTIDARGSVKLTKLLQVPATNN
jgi:lipopolysaccharide assembly outer membrane protein LptD (OstA)